MNADPSEVKDYKSLMDAISKRMPSWQGTKDTFTALIMDQIPDPIEDLRQYKQKTVTNPDTTTTFKSVNIRAFSFAFKLVAQNKDEAKQIFLIDQFFRRQMYPELTMSNFYYQFPSTWDIDFLYGTGVNTTVNPWIPEIHKCFLTGYSSSYNNDANSFHEGGAPYDVAFDLQFTETKTYSKNNILAGNNLGDVTAPAQPATPAQPNPNPTPQNPGTPPIVAV